MFDHSLFAPRVVATFLAFVSVAPAYAGNAPAAWVSGQGVNAAGCGAVTSPCRTFQYAHDNVLGPSGGVIAVHDPADYGSLTITKTLTIENEGGGPAGAVAGPGGTAITINAGATDTVVLRGLTLDGFGAASMGVSFNSGARIEIQNCTVRNFKDTGISLAASKFSYAIANSTATENNTAVLIAGLSAGSTGVISNARLNHNTVGITVIAADATIVDSNISSNIYYGVGNSGTTSIINTVINYNSLGINNRGSLTLSRLLVQKNETGVHNRSTISISSSGDNLITQNIMSDIDGGQLTLVQKQ